MKQTCITLMLFSVCVAIVNTQETLTCNNSMDNNVVNSIDNNVNNNFYNVVSDNRDKYVDYKMSLNNDYLKNNPDIYDMLEKYQQHKKIEIMKDEKSCRQTVQILQDFGVPVNSIYVMKNKKKIQYGSINLFFDILGGGISVLAFGFFFFVFLFGGINPFVGLIIASIPFAVFRIIGQTIQENSSLSYEYVLEPYGQYL